MDPQLVETDIYVYNCIYLHMGSFRRHTVSSRMSQPLPKQQPTAADRTRRSSDGYGDRVEATSGASSWTYSYHTLNPKP